MSQGTLIVICILFALIVILMLLRISYLKRLNAALDQAELQKVQTLLHQPQAKYLLPAYTRDLYQARVYFLSKDETALYEHLRKMMDTEYEEADEKQFLELYYHTFVDLSKQEFALEMLERIHQCKDEKFIRYCDWTNAVLLEGRNDLCDEISVALDNKDYYGFALGTCVYLMGIQKRRAGQCEEALLWLDTALDVLQKRDVYRSTVQKNVDELHLMGYKSPEQPQQKKRRAF